jgi:hypothetical protein
MSMGILLQIYYQVVYGQSETCFVLEREMIRKVFDVLSHLLVVESFYCHV